MVVRSLEKNKDPFRPREKGEELLGPEVSYLSAIGALIYLANCTRPGIAFSVNLLARHSSAPTRRHWTGVKQIFRYLRGTMDMGLFYSKDSKLELVGYADLGYRSDPHKGRSQTVNKRIPTTLYEDNEACIIQTREGYIKGDRTKHIDPKFFFAHELQQRGEIDVC
ncbi:secreted RxLR effector protein 161-like [Apium graveolens]|uniref:secreted RxLR effector protein 161-like n=1 Tax=Apium graveolens TaxID=4045 RepID=UPI003D79D9BA